MSRSLTYALLETAICPLILAGDGSSLEQIRFGAFDDAQPAPAEWRRDDGAFPEAQEQLLAYVAGERRTFELDLRPRGTEFQQKVWRTLPQIAYGRTASYGEIARRVGAPKASRAVGAANGRNPLPIVLPCHRIIGADGTLTGFGGGIRLKRKLLELEGAWMSSGEQDQPRLL